MVRSGDLPCQTSCQTQPHSCSNNSSYQLLNTFYLLLNMTLTSEPRSAQRSNMPKATSLGNKFT